MTSADDMPPYWAKKGGAVPIHHPPLWAGAQLTPVSISNTAAEEDLISILMPGNTLRPGDLLHLQGMCRISVNAGASTLRVRLRYGNSIALDSNALTVASSGNPNQIQIRGTIAYVNPTTQHFTLYFAGNRQQNFGPVLASFINLYGQGTTNEDPTQDQLLRLTLQFSVASASNNAAIQMAYVRG